MIDVCTSIATRRGAVTEYQWLRQGSSYERICGQRVGATSRSGDQSVDASRNTVTNKAGLALADRYQTHATGRLLSRRRSQQRQIGSAAEETGSRARSFHAPSSGVQTILVGETAGRRMNGSMGSGGRLQRFPKPWPVARGNLFLVARKHPWES